MSTFQWGLVIVIVGLIIALLLSWVLGLILIAIGAAVILVSALSSRRSNL